MIKEMNVFYPVFRKIINHQEYIDIYICDESHKNYKKGDILRLLENDKNCKRTDSFIHVEVTKIIMLQANDEAKIVRLYIRPRLDMKITVKRKDFDFDEL